MGSVLKIVVIANLSFKTVFLIDSIGALITAILLSQVLARFEAYFGMPRKVLFILSGIALVYALYSFFCFKLVKKNWVPFLFIIAGLNGLYLTLTLCLVFHYADKLTVLGLFYFFSEMIIILFLASFEFRFVLNNKERHL